MKFFFPIIFLILSTCNSIGQTAESIPNEFELPDKILWLNLDEAETKSLEANRKVMLFLYTDWCIWCKKMEKTTFKDETIANYINSKFLPAKFDAENEKVVEFQNKNYAFQDVEPRGVHELAMELMGGRITYPTIAFFDENWQLIQSIPNFHSAENFEMILTYFAGDFFKKTPWTSYQKNYVPLKEKEITEIKE